ncbi:hypothetical protein [Planktothricoides sp. SR001]|nr:hypothetical protein [Planktothricoides sp. SR001]
MAIRPYPEKKPGFWVNFQVQETRFLKETGFLNQTLTTANPG